MTNTAQQHDPAEDALPAAQPESTQRASEADASPAAQSWQNPKSRWRRRRRARVSWNLTAAGLLLLVTMLHGGLLAYIVSEVSSSTAGGSKLFMTAVVAMLSMVLLLIGSAIWQCISARRQSILTKRIVAHDGALCPWCRQPANASASDDSEHTCVHCGEACTLREMQLYWTNFALNPVEAMMWNSSRRKSSPRGVSAIIHQFTLPPNRRSRAFSIAGDIIAFFAFAYLFWLLLRNIWLAAILAGVVSVVLAWIGRNAFARYTHLFDRDSLERYCSGCDYQLPPDDGVPEKCPECGIAWRPAGSVYSGARVRWNKLTVIGAFIPAMVIMIIFTSPFGLGMKVRPTSSLINTVTTSRGFLTDQWAELNNRSLSQEAKIELAAGLLERRNKLQTLDRNANQWFHDQIIAGSIPEELAQEFRRGVIAVEFEGPQRARVGEQVTLGLKTIVRYEGSIAHPFSPVVCFAGFEIADDTQPLGREDWMLSLGGFGTVSVFYGLHDMASRTDRHQVTYTPQQPGEVVIRARYWLAFVTGGLQRFEWNEDGSPALPPGTDWHEPIVVEHRLLVR